MSVNFKGIITKVEAEAAKVKDALVKAGSEASTIASDVAADAPEVTALVDLFVPSASAITTAAATILEAVCGAVEAAGSAATGNGINISLDKAVVADVQALLPQLKAFLAKL